jgi:hypothetical protein
MLRRTCGSVARAQSQKDLHDQMEEMLLSLLAPVHLHHAEQSSGGDVHRSKSLRRMMAHPVSLFDLRLLLPRESCALAEKNNLHLMACAMA